MRVPQGQNISQRDQCPHTFELLQEKGFRLLCLCDFVRSVGRNLGSLDSGEAGGEGQSSAGKGKPNEGVLCLLI